MLYGRKPLVPPTAPQIDVPIIDYDDPEISATDLLLRKDIIKQKCPAALENLAIAQHRDQLRYLQLRDAKYQPKAKHFNVGDFVYVQQLQRKSGLMPRAQPLIYRVLEVRDTGVLNLQGKVWQNNLHAHVSLCALSSARD